MFQQAQHTSGHQPNAARVQEKKKPFVLQRKGENNFQRNAAGKIIGNRREDPISPEEQAKLKFEFEIYAVHNIKLLDANETLSSQERAEKLADFKKKKEKFLKKMGGDELKHWGGKKHSKLKAKYFSNYDAVIADKKAELKDAALKKIKESQESIGEVAKLLVSVNTNIRKETGNALPYLEAAQNELDKALASKTSAEEKLIGYTEGVKTIHLTIFDQVIGQLQLVINNTVSRIASLNENTAINSSFVASLKELSIKLDKHKSKISAENDLQVLIQLDSDNDFAELIKETTELVEKSRQDETQKQTGSEEYDISTLEVHKPSLEAEHNAIDKRLAAQPNTKDLHTLTKKQIHELAATAYAEGANQGYSLRKIVWVYINNVRRYKYKTAMSWSAAYNDKQWLFKKFMYVTGQGDEYKNDICYSGKTFGELFVKGEPDTLMNQLLDFTNTYVGEEAEAVPKRFSSLESQGYYNDMNLNYKSGDKAKWHKARLYLLHKLKKKVSTEDYSRYIQVVGTHENLTFLYDQYHIQEYLDKQFPSGIPAPNDIKRLNKKGNQWYLDGNKVSATTD
ncbi:MAG: hypothetical protein Crog4KO_21010 [Crocinitomicaceae bacterium]